MAELVFVRVKHPTFGIMLACPLCGPGCYCGEGAAAEHAMQLHKKDRYAIRNAHPSSPFYPGEQHG